MTTMMVPVVTGLYAGLLGILLIVLAMNVVRIRMGRKIGLGVGPDGVLEQPIRVHANFTENAPIFLILLLLAEMSGLSRGLLHLAGAVFVLARLLHAFGLSQARGTSFGRFAGSVGTWTTIGALSGYLIARAFG